MSKSYERHNKDWKSLRQNRKPARAQLLRLTKDVLRWKWRCGGDAEGIVSWLNFEIIVEIAILRFQETLHAQFW